MKVKALIVYPLKSGAGIELQEAVVSNRGLRFDREWMLVHTLTGKMISQRDFPELAQVRPWFERDFLALDAPGMPLMLKVPLAFSGLGRRVNVLVWNDVLTGVLCAYDESLWFQRFLDDIHVELVRLDPTFVRQSRGGVLAGDAQVAFADGYPLLVTSEASLEQLNAWLPEHVGPLPMDRFRPNIVLDECEAFSEDTMGRVRIGNTVEISGIEQCARCIMTTVDQKRGVRPHPKEPLATLTNHRMLPNLKGKLMPMFGMNCVHHNMGNMCVGDEVVIV